MEPKYRIVMRTGPNVGMAYLLDRPEMNIGRDLTNEIVINDPEVSRRHARIVLQGQNMILEDLGSTNGTSVNGQRLSGPYLLKTGEIIVFGEQVSMTFELLRPEFDATIGAPAPRPVPQPIEQPPQQPAFTPQGNYSPVDYPRQQPQQPVYPAPAPVYAPGQPPSGYQQPAQPVYPQPYPPAYPQQPLPEDDDEDETPQKRKIPVWLIVLIIAFVLLLCICGIIAYFMPEDMWCALFGWFFNAFYGAGTCP